MQIIAKVFDTEISMRDMQRECMRMKKAVNQENLHIALEHLIDRCLLYGKAKQSGFVVSEIEYDNALLDLLDQEEPLGLTSEAIQDLSADELEFLLNRQLMIKKYMQSLSADLLHVTPQKLHDFYDEQKEIFLRGECVRCSHILIRLGKDAEQRVKEVRAQINNADDFNRISKTCSDCPSHATCGDLGWFHKGKMISEIEEVAFSLKVGEISQPFKSSYGFHIIMVNDRKEAAYIPFDDIKESLSNRLQQIEKEFIISKHIADLRKQFADQITILNTDD